MRLRVYQPHQRPVLEFLKFSVAPPIEVRAAPEGAVRGREIRAARLLQDVGCRLLGRLVWISVIPITTERHTQLTASSARREQNRNSQHNGPWISAG